MFLFYPAVLNDYPVMGSMLKASGFNGLGVSGLQHIVKELLNMSFQTIKSMKSFIQDNKL